MHRMESFKTRVVRPGNGTPFRVLILRCTCGITINTSWSSVRSHWSKHVRIMKEAAAA